MRRTGRGAKGKAVVGSMADRLAQRSRSLAAFPSHGTQASSDEDALLWLQRSAGNTAATKLLAEVMGITTESTGRSPGAAVQRDLGADAEAELQRRLAATDAAGIERRRQRLAAILRSATKAEAKALYLRMRAPRADDRLATLFHERLASPTKHELLRLLRQRIAAEARTVGAIAEQPPGVWGTGREYPYCLVAEGITVAEVALYLSNDLSLPDQLARLNGMPADQPLPGGTRVKIPVGSATRPRARAEIAAEHAAGLYIGGRASPEGKRQHTRMPNGVVVPLAPAEQRAIRETQRSMAWLKSRKPPTPEEERKQFARDLALAKTVPPLLSWLFPAATRPYYRDPADRIKNPWLRHHARVTTAGAFGAASLGRDVLAVSVGVMDALYLAAIVLPGAYAAGAALGSSAANTTVTVVKGELSLAAYSLQALGRGTMTLFLRNPIAFTEWSAFGAGLVISCEGDVLGLLRHLIDNPQDAALLLAEAWTIHASTRTADGRWGTIKMRARPDPPDQQTDPTRLRLRTVEAAEIEVPPKSVGPVARRTGSGATGHGEPPGGRDSGGSGGQESREPTFRQRQRAAVLRVEADAADAEAARWEAHAAAARNPADAAKMRQCMGQSRAKAARLRVEAREFARGARSATDVVPEAAEIDAAFATAEAGALERVRLEHLERHPELLERLSRPLLRSRTGNRVVFRVEGGGGSRSVVDVEPASGAVAIRRVGVHLNFGSSERAFEFIDKPKYGPGARVVAFEVDEQWVQAARSGARPESGATRKELQLGDVRFADDQMYVPERLVPEFEAFVVPGSGRVLYVEP
jgi:hypothetical protein